MTTSTKPKPAAKGTPELLAAAQDVVCEVRSAPPGRAVFHADLGLAPHETMS